MIIKIDDKVKSRLTSSEEGVIKYINENESKLVDMSIVDIAEETYTSPSTVSRAIKKCGLNGFMELRYNLSKKQDEIDSSKNINEIFSKSLIETVQTLENLSVNKILEVLDLIQKSKKIIVIARGLTELVASEFSLKLELMDFNVFNISDPSIMKRISKEAKKEHLYIAFTLKGEDEDILTSIKNASGRGAKVITCSCGTNKELQKYSDHIIVGYKHSNISIKKYEVTSRIPLFIISRVILDYLVMNIE